MNNGVIKFVDQNEMHGKLTDHMQNVSEELFDSVSERRAALYSKCTYRLIFEPGYNENNVLEDIQTAFPPGELETTLFYLLEARASVSRGYEDLHSKMSEHANS